MPISEETVEKVTYNLVRRATTKIPDDIKKLLIVAADSKENTKPAKVQLSAILKGLQLAESNLIPICQDTGIILVYVGIGSNAKIIGNLRKAVKKAVKKATVDIPLRRTVVNPFTRKNRNNNPFIKYHFLYNNKSYLDLTIFARGCGAEYVTEIKMMDPLNFTNNLKKFVMSMVMDKAMWSCPPVIIGIGIGGTCEIAIELSKRAMLRPISERHPDKNIAKLESELIEYINLLQIGPMGLGGFPTCFNVAIEYVSSPIARVPVCVSFGCWAHRIASARIYSDDKIQYYTYLSTFYRDVYE